MRPPTIARGELPTLDVSFSDLAVFAECGHRYRLSNVLGFQTQVAPELGYGRAIHHVLRQVVEHVRTTGRTPSLDELDRLLSREFFVPFASRQAWETMRQAARKLVAAYVEQHGEDLRRVWAAERPFALHLDDGIVTGRADVILDDEGGRCGALAVVDYKVATEDAREDRYREQLQLYSAAGRGEGLDVEAAYLHELRDGAGHPVDISDRATALALAAAAGRLRKLRRGEFTPRPEEARCRACEYRRICSHAAPVPEDN